jgi:hypothetical protein
MDSKMVIDRVRREWSLRRTLETSHAATVEGLCERFGPLLEEGEDLGAAVDLVLRVLERCLDARQRDLHQANRSHSSQRSDLRSLRQERGEAARELRQTLVGIRETLKSFYGRKRCNRLLHIQGPTPKAHDPVNLLDQADSALAGLRHIQKEPPKTRTRGVQVPFEEWRTAWIESLETGHARLEKICRRLDEELCQSDSTQLGKDLALELHDRDLSAISNLQEALLVLGMKPVLARLVWRTQRPQGRPRRRRTAGRSNPTPEPPEADARKETATDSKALQEVSSNEVG